VIHSPSRLPVGSPAFLPADSYIRGVRNGLLFYYDPRFPFWYRDQVTNPLAIYKQWTNPEPPFIKEVDGVAVVTNNQRVNGSENVDIRAQDLTVMLATVGSGDKFLLTNKIRISTGNDGEASLTLWSTVSGKSRIYKFHSNDSHSLNRYGVNLIAFSIPAEPTQATDLLMARNGHVRTGRENYGDGDPFYNTLETTAGVPWDLNSGNNGGTGMVKVWDRLLSAEELAAETSRFSGELFGARQSTQFVNIPTVEKVRASTYDVGGTLEFSRGTSWDLTSGGEVEVAKDTTWDVFYAMILSRGTFWDVLRTQRRSVFDTPHNGEIDAQVLTPNIIRLDRYEQVIPDGATTKWRWHNGVSSAFQISRDNGGGVT
jgi:hypothetical protein